MSLSKTLYSLLSTDSTQEGPSLRDRKIVDWDVKNQTKETNEKLITLLIGQDKDRQVIEARRMLTEELPSDNYQVLKFVLDLLVEVGTCK